MTRYTLAALLALLHGVYAFVFATQAHNRFDLPTYIDLTEWPAVLAYLAAAALAWRRREQFAAAAQMIALFAFFAAHARFLFTVPLAFVVTTTGAMAFLLVLPVTWKPK